jgi:hypothetical protein
VPLVRLTPALLQKTEERRCIERVALARGCSSESPTDADGCWPDGWFKEPTGRRVPVEVVAAFERLPSEDPRSGAAWKRAHRQAEREAERIESETGVPVAWGAHFEKPFVVPLDGKHMIPPRLYPHTPVPWILAAVRQKIAKRYSNASDAILVVDYEQPFTLARSELSALAAAIGSGCPFREIWILNHYGDPPQRAPLVSDSGRRGHARSSES